VSKSYESPQRLTLVLEHLVGEEDWSVVAYLVRDNGQRERATLQHCPSRSKAAAALANYWQDLTGR